jgi:hypothetical protein
MNELRAVTHSLLGVFVGPSFVAFVVLEHVDSLRSIREDLLQAVEPD